MEVRVRGVDKNLVKLIDRNASKREMSRNEYLNLYLQMIDSSSVLSHEKNKVRDLLDKIYQGVENNYNRLDSLVIGFERLFVLVVLASGITPYQVDEVISENEW